MCTKSQKKKNWTKKTKMASKQSKIEHTIDFVISLVAAHLFKNLLVWFIKL